MPTYGSKLRRLLKDETPINAFEIAELLGVSPHTVKKWFQAAAAGQNRQTRLPDPDPADAAPIGNQPNASPRWKTKVVVEWALDPTKPGGQVFLDFDGEPIPRLKRGPGRPRTAPAA